MNVVSLKISYCIVLTLPVVMRDDNTYVMRWREVNGRHCEPSNRRIICFWTTIDQGLTETMGNETANKGDSCIWLCHCGMKAAIDIHKPKWVHLCSKKTSSLKFQFPITVTCHKIFLYWLLFVFFNGWKKILSLLIIQTVGRLDLAY